MADEREIPSHLVEKLEFGVYSAEEIQALSVKKLTNPQVFDSLMHPTFGGLYDPALGPQERDDVCSTCGLGSNFCPGHMGYISLPLVVYNPTFFRGLVQILRGSCFSCQHLLITTPESTLLQCQMSLLGHGLLSEAEYLRDMYAALSSTSKGADAEVSEKLRQHTDSIITGLSEEDRSTKPSKVKHVTECEQLILKLFLRGDYFKSRCPHCKTKKQDIRSEHNTKIFFSSKSSNAKQQAMKAKLQQAKLRMQKLQQMSTEGEVPEVLEEEVEEVDTSSGNPLQQQYLTPESVYKHLEQLWKSEAQLLTAVIRVFGHHGNNTNHINDLFFLRVMPVPPSRFRPVSVMNNRLYENAQTSNLNKVVQACEVIREILGDLKVAEKGAGNKKVTKESLLAIPGSTLNEKLQSAWLHLQSSVNRAMDSSLDKLNKDKLPGVRQLLEKKEGLFRKHMMGKRVNFAARSVIAPDPYLSTNEIGIPMVFARRLTYPQPVTPWNFTDLKQLVINGADIYPGATHVEYENGHKVSLHSRNPTQREAIAKQLLTPELGNKPGTGCKKVYRHLKNGDVLLLNRQPTLHRPSIQAHKARVLPGQKTLRMHYANCKAYNADFDGDEMNAHFPQTELGRSEAYHLMCTDYNYLVPKDGTPLAGLIQDHMISGVKLTMRGRHFDRHDYQQLVYSALSNANRKLILLPPCTIKPRVLWSGKQVFSTVLLNIIPEGKAPLNLEGKAKISGRNWVNTEFKARQWLAGGSPFVGDEMGESEVIINHGELLVGVLDKGHYGNTPYGLVHCCYELYGPLVVGKLLTALTRLFMAFLQWHGFTLGVEDILVTAKGDDKRRRVNRRAAAKGKQFSAKAVGLEDAGKIDDTILKQKLEEAQFAKDDGGMKDLDLQMKSCTDGLQNDVVKAIMPFRLLKKFPDNNLQLMVQSGAKGSTVNCMQISCLLGQIELEGRRPPWMLSGRALPSFLSYDTSPRAGGFVDGRFLTGIRPQEYFFHCMAGREGLIDTAVKTSRSGYLQRCLIKHLEGLVVGYDMSVRDSDGSIVQFQYGEDGIDVLKTQFLNQKQFPFLVSNQRALQSEKRAAEVREKLGGNREVELPDRYKCEKKKAENIVKNLRKRHKKWKRIQPEDGSTLRISPFLNWCERKADEFSERADLRGTDSRMGRQKAAVHACEKWAELKGHEERVSLETKLEFVAKQPEPFQSVLRSSCNLGATSEKFEDIVDKYIHDDPDKLIISEQCKSDARKITARHMRNLLHVKYLQSLIPPGEAVGLIAAQSIGEPSTQMTLNTFHFAGRGEMNVTLGIPRLREILMVASQLIKTPSMTVPILDTSYAKKKSKILQQKFTRVFLSQVLEDVDVTEYLSIKKGGKRCRVYKLRFSFLPYEMYKSEYYLNPTRILAFMEKSFFVRLAGKIKKSMEALVGSSLLKSSKVRVNRRAGGEDEEDEAEGKGGAPEDLENDIVDDDLHDDDAVATKLRERQDEEREYDGEEEERGEVEMEEEEDDDDLEETKEGTDSGMESGDDIMATRVKKLKNKVKVKDMDPQRVKVVLSQLSVATDYVYDTEEELWCELTLEYPLASKKLDMSAVVNAESKVAVVTQTKGITRCFMSQSKKQEDEGTMYLKTEGINIMELYNYQDILDVNKLYTNDIHAVGRIYGIEAACRVLIKEIRDVFAAYGITVDYRHLSLIADYLTFQGSYKSFSRGGIASNASPLQKMTYETSMEFLKTATLMGATDELQSPSSRLVIGRLVHGGTGAFDLLQPL